jgi:hypothetical protein
MGGVIRHVARVTPNVHFGRDDGLDWCACASGSRHRGETLHQFQKASAEALLLCFSQLAHT